MSEKLSIPINCPVRAHLTYLLSGIKNTSAKYNKCAEPTKIKTYHMSTDIFVVAGIRHQVQSNRCDHTVTCFI